MNGDFSRVLLVDKLDEDLPPDSGGGNKNATRDYKKIRKGNIKLHISRDIMCSLCEDLYRL